MTSLQNLLSSVRPLQTAAVRLLQVAVLAVLARPEAQAANISFTGNFAMDDELAQFTFQLSSTSTVTFRTYGYAGGTNAVSQVILAGGFDPLITIFAGLGPTAGYLVDNDDGGCPTVDADPVTNACLDSYYQFVGLPAGDYTVVLSQAGNVFQGTVLSDPFSQSGQGNYTGPAAGIGPGSFVDPQGRQRTSAWALDILNVDSATGPGAVPEPTSLALFSGAGLALMALSRRRR